jgi:TonB-like protein
VKSASELLGLHVCVLLMSVSAPLSGQVAGKCGKDNVGSAGHIASGPSLGLPKYSMIHGVKVYRIGGGVSSPQPLQCLFPSPRSEDLYYISDPNNKATATSTQAGTVIVQVIIDRSGRVRYPEIVQGLGEEENRRAVAAVRTCTFRPSSNRSRNVAIETNLGIMFP